MTTTPDQSSLGTAPAAQSAPARRPTRRVYGVIRYDVRPGQAERIPEVYPRHEAYVDEFAASGDLVSIGTFATPEVNGSMALFVDRAAAARFAADDPFVLEGVAEPHVLTWYAMEYPPGA